MRKTAGIAWLLCALAACARAANPGAGPTLLAYNVAAGEAALAGISSGGFMAVQLHVAYSATFRRGAAIFAGGPYDCAQGSLATAHQSCQYATAPLDLPALESITASYAAAGDVDPLSNLMGAQVWLWSGTQDNIVEQAVMDGLQSYYSKYGAETVYRNSFPAGHGWISPQGPGACGAEESPFINDCGVDVEEEFLTQLFGPLNPKPAVQTGQFLHYSQDEFFDDGDAPLHSLDEWGSIYVPASCASGQACRLLVALHGCDQSVSQVGYALANDSGLDGWADSNRVLVLYPQAIPTPMNTDGCWDWWGYDDPDYAKKSGRQMLALKRMVDRISGG